LPPKHRQLPETLATCDWRPLFLSDITRQNSGLLPEFFQRCWALFLPPEPDGLDIFWIAEEDFQRFSQLWISITNDEKAWDETRKRIRADAVEALSSIGVLIEAEQESPELRRRLKQVNVPPVRLGLSLLTRDTLPHLERVKESGVALDMLIHHIERSYPSWGTSLKLAYRVTTLKQYRQALTDAVEMIESVDDPMAALAKIKHLVDQHQSKAKPVSFLRDRTALVLYEIVSINANAGSKYVAKTRSEFWSFLRAGLIGGVFVAIFALLKLYIDVLGPPSLVRGFLYSVNYAACFILVDALGGTIATKQPAMTANLLGDELYRQEKWDRPDSHAVAKLVARVFRSQLASLVGNVVMAIAVAALLVYLLNPVAALDDGVAKKLLEKNDVTTISPIIYAALAGVFLSLSGFIAGYLQNFVIYTRVKERYQWAHPHRVRRINAFNYLSKKSAKISGSIVLGFFLGYAGVMGDGLGLPLDIRHVAFSSAHLSLGGIWLTKFFEFLPYLLLNVAVIGSVNFVTSFLMTFGIALRARGLNSVELGKVLWGSTKLFLRRPWLYIFPFDEKQSTGQ